MTVDGMLAAAVDDGTRIVGRALMDELRDAALVVVRKADLDALYRDAQIAYEFVEEGFDADAFYVDDDLHDRVDRWLHGDDFDSDTDVDDDKDGAL